MVNFGLEKEGDVQHWHNSEEKGEDAKGEGS